LLDPEFGVQECIASGSLPGNMGLIVAVESTGYAGESTARLSQLQCDWSVAQTKRLGASAAKLLVYYHPDSWTAPQIESLVLQVAEECAAQDLALILEALTYSLDATRKKLAAVERPYVVIETARRLTPLGADVLKTEFPLDAEADEREWRHACAELSQASAIPWVLLSASIEYETFLRQATVAFRSGASGVAVGRAVWQEAAQLSGEACETFLHGIARERMQALTEMCDSSARPWRDFYTAKMDAR
jgi:tagatose-1,6-bisphosphate aldolase